MALTNAQIDPLLGLVSAPLDNNLVVLSGGSLTAPVIAGPIPELPLPGATHLQLADVGKNNVGVDWQAIDYVVTSFNGESGSHVYQGSSSLDVVDYSALPKPDNLIGLTLSDDPAELSKQLLTNNQSPLIGDAWKQDQLLVAKGNGDLDLLAGMEAVKLSPNDDHIVLKHGQNLNLWIDGGAGHDTADIWSQTPPAIDQWRGVEQLIWHPVDANGVPTSKSSTLNDLHEVTVTEGVPFSLALQDLFPASALPESVRMTPVGSSEGAWLTSAEQKPDSTVQGRIILETLLRDSSGHLLSDEEIRGLQPGTTVQADIVVTDNRETGGGLLGLNVDLGWNPQALQLNSTKIDSSLPLFRSEGKLSEIQGLLTGLSGASLPNAGSGSVLGDNSRDLFASLMFTTGNIRQEGLGLQLTPKQLPTRKNLPLIPESVLPVGTEAGTMKLIKGIAKKSQVGQHQLLIDGSYADGKHWQQILVINVLNKNDAPTARPAPQLNGVEKEDLKINIAQYFDDPDLAYGDKLSYQFAGNIPSWLELDSSTGELTGIPGNDEVGALDFDIEVHDLSGASTRQSFHLVIANVNDAPTWSGQELPTIQLREGRNFKIQLPDQLFTDPDQGDTLRYSLDLQGHNEVASWLKIDPLTGNLTGLAPAAGGSPIDVRIVAMDNQGATADVGMTITIGDASANRAPYLIGDPLEDRTIKEGETISFKMSNIFRDDDFLIGDSLRFTAEIPSWLHFDSSTGIITGTADNDSVGTAQITFKAEDLDGATAVTSFLLSVDNVNQAPERNAPARESKLLKTGSSLQLDVDTIFKDIDTIHGDRMTYTLKLRSTSTLGIPDWLTWDGYTGELTLDPGKDDRGILSLLFTATDLSGAATSYQLDVGIVSPDGLIEVNRALQDFSLKEGEHRLADISDAFLKIRGADEISYSTELFKRTVDGGLQAVSSTQADWITIAKTETSAEPKADTITIQPEVRLLDSGEIIRPEELSKLAPGTALQVSITVDDLRKVSGAKGVVGLDLGVQWSGLTLDQSLQGPLQRAISSLFPLFRKTDISKLNQNQLTFSAASLPALGAGEAIGDTLESFATLYFRTNDNKQPVSINLNLRDAQQGGVGIGLADGSTSNKNVNIVNWTSKSLVNLDMLPSIKDSDRYGLRVTASAGTIDSVSQVVAVDVGNLTNQSPVFRGQGDSLSVKDNTNNFLSLDTLFGDPNGDRLDYAITFTSAQREQEDLLREMIHPAKRKGKDGLLFIVPGLTAPVNGEISITASDGLKQITQNIIISLAPRSQLLPLTINPVFPAINTGQSIGLGRLMQAKPIGILDKKDSAELLLRSSNPVSIRLSESFKEISGVSDEEASQIEGSWINEDDNGQTVIRIPLNSIADRIGGDIKAYDLDWLDITAPDEASSSLKVGLKTVSEVEGDPGGQAYGTSESTWQDATLLTRSQVSNNRPINTPEVEQYLYSLIQKNGVNAEQLLEDSHNPADLASSALLAWRKSADYESATALALSDITPVVALKIKTLGTNGTLSSKAAQKAYGLSDLAVISIDDPIFEEKTVGSEIYPGSTIQTPFDPLYFSITKASDTQNWVDSDPSRPGNQIVVDVDLSLSGLHEGDLNRYMKFVSSDAIDAAASQNLSLVDLDGNAITEAGWYDFTQRVDASGKPIGDGARFIISVVNGERKLIGIRITLTDNAYGDNNLGIGLIDDPGMPVHVVAQTSSKADLPISNPSPAPITPATNPTPTPVVPQSSNKSPSSTDPSSLEDHGSLKHQSIVSPKATKRAGSEANFQYGSNQIPVDLEAIGSSKQPKGTKVSESSHPNLDAPPISFGSLRGGTHDPNPHLSHGSTQQDTIIDPGKNPNRQLSAEIIPSINGGSGFDLQLGRSDRVGSQQHGDFNKQLHALLSDLISSTKSEPALIGLLLGMVIMPSGVERSIRSFMLDSKLERGIRPHRRNPDLEARWSVRLQKGAQEVFDLVIELRGGRIRLLQANPNAHGVDFEQSQPGETFSRGILWNLLDKSKQPGFLLQEYKEQLSLLLTESQLVTERDWIAWLDTLQQHIVPNASSSEKRGLQALRHALTLAQDIDMGMADALMAIELLDSHVKMGGQLDGLIQFQHPVQA